LKINIQKWTRVIPCLIAVVLILLVSVVPARAATFTGEWTFNANVSAPTWETISITFVSNGVTYTQMVYESYSEAYEVPLIKFKSDTESRPAIYWRNGQTYFTDINFRYIDFNGVQSNMSDVFSNWMFSNAQQGRITLESEAAGNIKDNIDDAAGRLEDVNKVWDDFPEPSLVGDEYDFLVGQRPEYQKYMNFWQVAWQNSTLYEMMLALGGLMLASYLVFAGK